jgi:glycine/D-amino acid oxidase-like deaminating enzyme
MKIGVLGTGIVGSTIASKLSELGHEVRMGSRSAGNETARAWAAGAGPGASEGNFSTRSRRPRRHHRRARHRDVPAALAPPVRYASDGRLQREARTMSR